MTPLMLAWAPWTVGPTVSAHEVEDGVVVQARGDAFTGGAVGGRVGVQGGLGKRVVVGLDGVHGAGWSLCPDCRATGVSGLVRLTAVRHPAFHAAVWGRGTATLGSPEGLAGVSLEGGRRHLRFDGSTPLTSSTHLLTTLRIGPEVGVTASWTERHATRVAVVGLEPSVALQHRWRVRTWVEVEPTVRFGEEGLGVGLGLRAVL